MTKAKKIEAETLLTTRRATTPTPCVTRSVVLVTPELADEWLGSNTHNRKLDPRAVTALAAMISAGQWRVTHQGVAFGADGSLYDGQHRLHAIVQAGVPVSLEVTRGLSPKDLDVIDNGGKGARRADEVLFITDGVKIGRNRAGVLTAASQMLSGSSLVGVKKQSPAQLRESMAAYGQGMEAIHSALAGGHVAGICSAPVIAPLVVAWKTEPDRTVAFATALRTGENLGPRHPALLLRNFLLTRGGRGLSGGAHRDEVALRTFSALDAFIRGADLKFIRTNESARTRYVGAWKRAAGV